ncbi:MAG TPA: ABC transporter permease [Sphingobacteriaceae bacterium]|nr:ABC transporter permease [Sphingobacteriaceae bacterium]
MMVFKLLVESFRFAFSALRSNKTRTFLSLLGITIGIMTIVGVFSAVDTLRSNLESSVEKLGSKTIYVSKWPWDGGPDFPWWKYLNRPEPSIRDFNQLQNRLKISDGICYTFSMNNRTAKFRNSNVEGATVVAASYDFYKVRNLEFEEGRYFTEMETNRGVAVGIIGSTVAEGLFPNIDPIGKEIDVLGRRINIVGVFKQEGEGMLMDVSLDNTILLPLNYVRNIVNPENYGPDIVINASAQYPLEELESELRGVMRSIHRISPKQEDDFSLNKTTIITGQLDQMFMVINSAGLFIGIFSILVGGFGIANIMFVSVKERTHIIGIQKSLGAKNFFILSQFLIEAIALCIIGGLIGLGIVYLLAFIANVAFGLPIIVDFGKVILTLILSTIIGLIAGIIPAVMAARLDPVEAIRSN